MCRFVSLWPVQNETVALVARFGRHHITKLVLVMRNDDDNMPSFDTQRGIAVNIIYIIHSMKLIFRSNVHLLFRYVAEDKRIDIWRHVTSSS